MEKINFTFLAAVILVISTASAQVQIPESCPDHQVVSDFDLSQYLGQWYEILAYPTIFSPPGDCITARYRDIGNGSVEVYNAQVLKDSGDYDSITGYANLEDPTSTEAKLLVNFPSTGSYNSSYWVLDTDYNNYSIVFSCRDVSEGTSFQTIWFLSKDREIGSYWEGYVKGYLTAIGASLEHLKPTRQTLCPPP